MEHSPAGARRDLSRAHVEQTALRLFHAHGFEAVTVEQICVAAGIAPATFYRYFGTKDGVLFAYRPLFLQALRDAVSNLPAAAPRGDQLRSALLAFARFLDAHTEALSTRDEIVSHNPLLLARSLLVQREWETELAVALARRYGVPADDREVWWQAALGLVVVRAGFRRWRLGAMPSLVQAVSESLDEAVTAIHGLQRC